MYSQVYQDEFVLKLMGKRGFFVDIGAGYGYKRPNGGNSQLLEELGWTGILIEGNEELHKYSKENRKSVSVHAFLPDKKLIDIFKEYNCPNIIDYLSIDIDPTSLVALEDFPFDEYEFKVLTFEHDSYGKNLETKNKSWEILIKNGYTCLHEDVQTPDFLFPDIYLTLPFEDWWVNKKYFSTDFINNNKTIGKKAIDIVRTPIK